MVAFNLPYLLIIVAPPFSMPSLRPYLTPSLLRPADLERMIREYEQIDDNSGPVCKGYNNCDFSGACDGTAHPQVRAQTHVHSAVKRGMMGQ